MISSLLLRAAVKARESTDPEQVAMADLLEYEAERFYYAFDADEAERLITILPRERAAALAVARLILEES